jgi:hypothetical protein
MALPEVGTFFSIFDRKMVASTLAGNNRRKDHLQTKDSRKERLHFCQNVQSTCWYLKTNSGLGREDRCYFDRIKSRLFTILWTPIFCRLFDCHISPLGKSMTALHFPPFHLDLFSPLCRSFHQIPPTDMIMTLTFLTTTFNVSWHEVKWTFTVRAMETKYWFCTLALTINFRSSQHLFFSKEWEQ